MFFFKFLSDNFHYMSKIPVKFQLHWIILGHSKNCSELNMFEAVFLLSISMIWKLFWCSRSIVLWCCDMLIPGTEQSCVMQQNLVGSLDWPQWYLNFDFNIVLSHATNVFSPGLSVFLPHQKSKICKKCLWNRHFIYLIFLSIFCFCLNIVRMCLIDQTDSSNSQRELWWVRQIKLWK